MEPDIQFLNSLTNSWTAVVKLNNGLIETIWHTALLSMQYIIAEVISVSSDYPRVTKIVNQTTAAAAE